MLLSTCYHVIKLSIGALPVTAPQHRPTNKMPTIFREGPYRFFFYASNGDEPLHVHVHRDDKIAKFWLNPVRLQTSGGLRRPEIGLIARIIAENQTSLMESWNEFFDR